MNRRGMIAGALAAGAALVAARAPARADEWPTKPVRMIVPYIAGSPVDVLARVLFQHVSMGLGVPVLVENRPGAGTTIGIKAVATAAPDGYTLLLSGQALAYMSTMYPELGLDPLKSFAPVGSLAGWSHVMIVPPALPVKTLDEFVRRARANPGKLSFGYGQGTSPQIVGEYFRTISGLDILGVPYRGGEQARLDLLGGRIDVNFVPLSNVLPMIRDGQVRAIAVTSHAREPQLPDVPTMAESGFPQIGFDPDVWQAVLAPAGTPEPILEKMNAQINVSLNTPEVRETLERLGMGLMGGSRAELAKLLAEHVAKWPGILKAANVQPQ